MKYNVVRNRKNEPISVTMFHRGRTYTATAEHPNFDQIIAEIESKRPRVRMLIDFFKPGSAIARGFRLVKKFFENPVEAEQLAGRATMKDNRLYFDGKLVDDTLAKCLMRYQAEGHKDYRPLVKFLVKVMQNPSEHSREYLFTWMAHNSFSFTHEGDIIGYKSVTPNAEHGYVSPHSSGTAYCDGVLYERQRTPHTIGKIVHMEREWCVDNPNVACSRGLHVGTWTFAQGYGSVMVEVLVNPADVVSVPADGYGEKMRVCRYKVLRIVTAEDKKALRKAILSA